MTTNPRLEAALALHRFGFGPVAGSIAAIADDPRGALLWFHLALHRSAVPCALRRMAREIGKRGAVALERPTHALRRRRIDRSSIDEEVEPGIVLVDDLRSFARRGDAALDRVGHDRVGDALQRDRLQGR